MTFANVMPSPSTCDMAMITAKLLASRDSAATLTVNGASSSSSAMRVTGGSASFSTRPRISLIDMPGETACSSP